MIVSCCHTEKGGGAGGLHEDAVRSVHDLVYTLPRGGPFCLMALSFFTSDCLLFGQKRGGQWAPSSVLGEGCVGSSSLEDSSSLPTNT